MKAIIIGGGIGGLTTAIALHKKGIDFELLEQANEIKEVGAGLWVAANAQHIFERLGVLPAIAKAGKDLDTINVVNTNYRIISSIDCKKVKEKYKYGTLAFHRAELHKILLNMLPAEKIHTSKHFSGIGADNRNAVAVFSDGSEAYGDILICADGIKSIGRKYVCPDVNMRYSGQTCWRFITDFKLPAEQEKNMYEMWGSGKGLRAAWSQVNERQAYCYITTYISHGGKDNRASLKGDLKKLCAEFPEPLPSLIDSVDSEKIIRSDLYDFCPLKKWHQERVVLVGDAAHATTPNLGQGACQAIESAYVLADCLSRHSTYEEAFRDYQRIRMPKAHWITNTSWRMGQVTNTSGIRKKVLEFFMRVAPSYIEQKQFGKMYALNY